jgi:YwqJ-like deaminase
LSEVLSKYADDALTKFPDANLRPGAVAILEGEIDGKLYQLVEYSVGGQGLKPSDLLKKYHPLVKEWIEKVPRELQFRGSRGKCGENFTISEWLYQVEKSKGIKQGKISLKQAQESFEGVVSKAKRIQNKDKPFIIQGLDKKACDYCNPMLEHFNIKEIF